MLVIFDCDGVLVDSEWLGAEVFSQELARIGFELSAQECFRSFHGHSLSHCFGILERQYRCTLPANFAETIQMSTQTTFAERLQAVEGVEAVLCGLQSRGIDYCVASNGSLAKIHHSLTVTGLMPYLEGKCFSAESVLQGKPAPDLFLMAANTLGKTPAACIVIEDSHVGIAAANAAGMMSLFFGADAPPNGIKAAFTRMTDLLGLIDGAMH